MFVRGPGLAESMSQYLIDRINATANIEVLFEAEGIALTASHEGRLDRVLWKNRKDWRRDRTSNPQPVPLHRRRPQSQIGFAIAISPWTRADL